MQKNVTSAGTMTLDCVFTDLTFTLLFSLESVSRFQNRCPRTHLMSGFFRGRVAVFTFPPVLGFGMLMNVIVLYSRCLHIRIRMTALAGMRCISSRFTRRFGYNSGILMCMSVGQLRNSLFLYKAANRTGEFHHTVSRFRCFLCNRTFTESMQFRIQYDITSVAADRPVLILIVLNFT